MGIGVKGKNKGGEFGEALAVRDGWMACAVDRGLR